jgi:hypothetical protein
VRSLRIFALNRNDVHSTSSLFRNSIRRRRSSDDLGGLPFQVHSNLESPMSKSNSAKVTKQARSKVAMKAQRASQAVVRSPKHPNLRSVASFSAESSPKVHSRPDAAVFEKATTAIAVPEKPTMASQDDSQRTMRDNDLTKPFNVFSAMTNVGAYQRRLPEVAQAYIQLPFEFTQRLAQIKSPLEIPSVFADLATKQFTTSQSLIVPNQRWR